MSEQDICANRHRGNEQSKEAFEKVESGLPNQRAHILLMVQKAGFKGLTVHEAAELLNTTPNAVSGRFSELKRDGQITKRGTRPTPSGCKAGVFVAFKNNPELHKGSGPSGDYWFDLFEELYK